MSMNSTVIYNCFRRKKNRRFCKSKLSRNEIWFYILLSHFLILCISLVVEERTVLCCALGWQGIAGYDRKRETRPPSGDRHMRRH